MAAHPSCLTRRAATTAGEASLSVTRSSLSLPNARSLLMSCVSRGSRRPSRVGRTSQLDGPMAVASRLAAKLRSSILRSRETMQARHVEEPPSNASYVDGSVMRASGLCRGGGRARSDVLFARCRKHRWEGRRRAFEAAELTPDRKAARRAEKLVAGVNSATAALKAAMYRVAATRLTTSPHGPAAA